MYCPSNVGSKILFDLKVTSEEKNNGIRNEAGL
jgi:hypothetical protein